MSQAGELGADLILGRQGVVLSFASAAKKAGTGWKVRELTLEEGISAPYCARLELSSSDPGASAREMLGESASLTIERDGAHRIVHGIIELVEEGEADRGQRVARVLLVPALAALAHSSNSRIFENQTVVQVVESVINLGLTPFGRKLEPPKLLRTDYPKREYIVQHRETDLVFVTRLLAEEGLWYYFSHPDEGGIEQMLLSDSPTRAPAIAESAEVELSLDRETQARHQAITELNSVERLRTTKVQTRQYDWTNPTRVEDVTEQPKVLAKFESNRPLVRYEHGDILGYEYNDSRYSKYDTKTQAVLRLEESRSDRHVFIGKSNVIALQPGHYMKVEDEEYLLLNVEHQGSMLINGGQASKYGEFTNSFTCMRREQPYRPERQSKPKLLGIQTAIVVDQAGGKVAPESGTQGSDIATDEHGRVRVKFHWDTTPAGGKKPSPPSGSTKSTTSAEETKPTTSAWLRVAQSWAGAGWGSQFVPRVGMEVVVQFIDGDPDQPLVTGCVYNGQNHPPYAATPTQSGIKTQSSIKPGDYNELRFDDAAGSEQIYVRAQKDYVEDVLNDHTTTVTGKQTQVVKKSQTETVQGNASLSVGGKRTKNVGGDKEHGEEISIKGERKTTVSKKHTEIFEDEHEVTVTKAVKENYLATHERTVTETQTLEAKADKLEHVVGTYELTTDTAYVLNQAGTKVTLEGGKVALDAAGAISVTRGPATIDIDDGGNIAFKTTGAISFEVGPNKIMISMSGIELESPMGVSAKVAPSELALTPASANVKSVNTTIEATAVCAIKGTAMVGLNS